MRRRDISSEKEKLGPYRIMTKVGHGAMAEVWKVKKNSKVFALKRLKSHLEKDANLKDKLKREGKALMGLKGRPHFPAFHELGEVKGAPYLLMEYINGLNLQDVIFKTLENKVKIPLSFSCFIALEIGKALKELHQGTPDIRETLVHQDLKPLNVMVDIHGRVKVIDLGIGIDTMQFTPLETLEQRVVTTYNDIFALGQIFFQMLHQRPLFSAPTKLKLYFKMKKFSFDEMEWDPDLPKPLIEILKKCLDQGSANRYRSIEEFLNDLTLFMKNSSLPLLPADLGNWIQELKKVGCDISILKKGKMLGTGKGGYFLNLCSIEKISPPWSEAVAWVKELYLEKFPGLIHSIYLRGSVPRGEAIEGVSDIDSLAVIKGDPGQYPYQWVPGAIEKFKKQFPFSAYVEFDFLPLEGLLEKSEYYSSRFILKSLSACIYGEDLAKKIPRFGPTLEIAFSLYGNFPEVLSKAKKLISKSKGKEETKYWCVWIMKRILRTGSSLVIEKEKGFSRELYPCFEIFAKYYPERSSEMREALELAINPIALKGKLLKFLDTFGKWLKDEAVRIFQERDFYKSFHAGQ